MIPDPGVEPQILLPHLVICVTKLAVSFQRGCHVAEDKFDRKRQIWIKSYVTLFHTKYFGSSEFLRFPSLRKEINGAVEY